MDDKLHRLFLDCTNEWNKIGIDILNEKEYGKIDISISKRNNKRYGCCKQEEPDKKYKIVTKRGYKRIINYEKFNKHHIEISPWVMQLEDEIIKNTIMHEMIHCLPYCNNHGKEFKKYANLVNTKYDYNISRVGNKKDDYEKSNIEFKEEQNYKYRIICKDCEQEFYRQRLNRNFTRKYRCGKCGGKFEVIKVY